MANTKTLYHGPMTAYWSVKLLDTGSVSQVCSHAVALAEIAYWRADGRPVALTRTELCPTPGCNHGTGTRNVLARGRGAMYRTVECVGCRGEHETPEEL